MELHLRIAGWLMLVLAIGHIRLPRRFNWKSELPKLSLINRQIMQVHTFFIALAVFLMGSLCIYSAEALMNTYLGQILCLGFFIFWFTRLVFQFFVYSKELWAGKRFETIVHVLFSILWTYFSVVFLLGANLF